MATTAELSRIAQAFSPDLPVTRAFSATRGIRPGLEALAILPAVLVFGSLPFSNLLAGAVVTAIVCGLVVISVSSTREPYVIATTAESIVVLRCSRSHRTRPVKVIQSVPLDPGIELVGDGDRAVIVAGVRYWVSGVQRDEARRAAVGAK